MKNIVVYGLGKSYKAQEQLINFEYNVIAVSDGKVIPEESEYADLYIEPSNISGLDYDCVYVTSKKYYQEIKEDLVNKYNIPCEKIISELDQWWYNPNAEIRDQWVVQKLRDIPSSSKILDAGAGNCRYKKYCDHLEYTSQDFGKYDEVEDGEGLRNGEKWESRKCDILCDIISIPVEDESFDVILCTEVFEHLKNPILALKEFNRILKHGGKLFLTAPFCSITHMAPFYYSNGFSKFWYQDNLKDAGFSVKEITPYGNYFTYLAQELARLPEMAKVYGKEVQPEGERAIVNMLTELMKQAKCDRGSDEILCFGHFVEAEKE